MQGMIVNPYADDSIFGMIPLTQAMMLVPNTYGYLGPKNIFSFEGVPGDSVSVEMMNGIIQILESKPRGTSEPNQAKQEKRSGVILSIPHIPSEDQIRPKEIKNVRAFGSTNQLEQASTVMNGKLIKNHRNYEITWEFLSWGALKGKIIDADGVTELADFYKAFDVTKKRINFELDNSDTDVVAKCKELTDHIEDNLLGDTMTGVRCPCSPEFFDSLVSHRNVEKFYLNHAAAVELGGPGSKDSFTFKGITFERYRGRGPLPDGEIKRFIDIGKGHAYPEGTFETFKGAWGSGEFMDTINSNGVPIYVLQEPLKFNKGIDLYFESNPLPYCSRPGVLVEVLRSEADSE